MQIVYISKRPKQCFQTIERVMQLMEFVSDVVVCVPDQQLNEFEADKAKLEPRIPIRIFGQNKVLTNAERSTLDTLDHQQKNYLLRTRLARLNEIDAQFIMSDDDARPLKKIDRTLFLEDEKYHHYYFHDLARWKHNRTDFDRGQLNTHAVLNQTDLPHLSYASHMPQIIDKDLFVESARFFKDFALQHSLCEWSCYFNYAYSHYPEKFHLPSTYLTLCWPEHPLAWKPGVEATQLYFENFTPSLYQQGGIFHQLSEPNNHSRIPEEQLARNNVQKVILWKSYVIDLRHPEQTRGLRKYLKWRTWVNKLTRPLSY